MELLLNVAHMLVLVCDSQGVRSALLVLFWAGSGCACLPWQVGWLPSEQRVQAASVCSVMSHPTGANGKEKIQHHCFALQLQINTVRLFLSSEFF